MVCSCETYPGAEARRVIMAGGTSSNSKPPVERLRSHGKVCATLTPRSSGPPTTSTVAPSIHTPLDVTTTPQSAYQLDGAGGAGCGGGVATGGVGAVGERCVLPWEHPRMLNVKQIMNVNLTAVSLLQRTAPAVNAQRGRRMKSPPMESLPHRCTLKFGVLRKYGGGSGMSHAPFPTNLLPLPTTFAV